MGEPSAFDRRVKIFKERARLTVSRFPEGGEVEVSLSGAAAGRRELTVDEGPGRKRVLLRG